MLTDQINYAYSKFKEIPECNAYLESLKCLHRVNFGDTCIWFAQLYGDKDWDFYEPSLINGGFDEHDLQFAKIFISFFNEYTSKS